jgi:hypothetical protein
MGDEPTLGEVTRRLDDVARRLEASASKAERVYVRRDTWAANRESDQKDVKAIADRVDDLERADEAMGAFKRQLLLALGIAAISALVSVLIMAAGLLFGGT